MHVFNYFILSIKLNYDIAELLGGDGSEVLPLIKVHSEIKGKFNFV